MDPLVAPTATKKSRLKVHDIPIESYPYECGIHPKRYTIPKSPMVWVRFEPSPNGGH